MKIFNKNINLATALATIMLPVGGLMVAGCTDWDDHYESKGVEGSDVSIWQEISQRPELSDFAEVLQQTKVFRMHKKTSASYAEYVDGGQSLTVMAPVNGTFNKAELLEMVKTAQGDSAVERTFIMNHISRTPISAVTDTIRMLNNKKTFVSETDINGIAIKQGNQRCKNGILHIMESKLPYNRTVFETLNALPQFQSAGKRITQYMEDVFNENASVISGYVDGMPIYADSVVYERNKLMDEVGYLNAEDSTYYVCVPTNEGWNAAWEEAKTYFQFDNSKENTDSLAEYWATRSLLADAVFSKTVQANMQDSVKSKFYNIVYPKYSVFHKPFAADGIFGKAKGSETCSNGTLYYYDEWPFTPEQTYFREIEEEAESTYDILTYKLCEHTVKALNGDSISRGKFLMIKPNKGTDNWSVTYKILNTLSGKYDIYVYVLPRTIDDPADNKRPCKFNATITYKDLDGKVLTQKFGGSTGFKTDGTKLSKVLVAENVLLPACNYREDNTNVTLEITCNINPKTENTTYNRTMYLDKILFVPKR